MAVQKIIVRLISVSLEKEWVENDYDSTSPELFQQFESTVHIVDIDMSEIHSYFELESAVEEKLDMYLDGDTKIAQIIPESAFGFGK